VLPVVVLPPLPAALTPLLNHLPKSNHKHCHSTNISQDSYAQREFSWPCPCGILWECLSFRGEADHLSWMSTRACVLMGMAGVVAKLWWGWHLQVQ
jgi:hypothetical protein